MISCFTSKAEQKSISQKKKNKKSRITTAQTHKRGRNLPPLSSKLIIAQSTAKHKGWHYFKDGAWHWTQGMPSRPFMYNTASELRSMNTIADIAREVFGSD